MSDKNNFVHSFLSLRKTIGLIGILFPFVLWIGVIVFKEDLQPSISEFYYTCMRDVFVGSLCAIGLFLFFYKGYDGVWGHDDIVGNLAGFMAFGVAFFPTPSCLHNATGSKMHIIFAVLLFLILAYISAFRFTKSDIPRKQFPPGKKTRNRIYIISAVTIVLSLFLLYLQWEGIILTSWEHATYIGEVVALFAFGTSWLVKGNFLTQINLMHD